MKGYIAWDYWNHKILARTTSWKEADAAVKEAIKNRGSIGENWFGVEAVENINKDALNRVIKNPGRTRHTKKFDRCVTKVKRSRSAADPYAVCESSVKKPRRKNPDMNKTLRSLAREGSAKLRKHRKESYFDVMAGKPPRLKDMYFIKRVKGLEAAKTVAREFAASHPTWRVEVRRVPRVVEYG